MSEQPRSPLTWLVATLLTAQLGLLWLHGALLHRQQAQLTQLHEDIQDLADSLDAQTEGDSGDSGDDSDWAPARSHHRHARPHLARTHFRIRQEDDKPQDTSRESDAAANAERKELEDSRKSAREAVAKGRDMNQKLSISENYRKGQQEREVQEAQYEWTRWVWLAVAVLGAAFGIRYYMKRNA